MKLQYLREYSKFGSILVTNSKHTQCDGTDAAKKYIPSIAVYNRLIVLDALKSHKKNKLRAAPSTLQKFN